MHCFAIVKAHTYIYSNWKKLWRKRKEINAPFGDFEEIYPHSIVWDHFAEKKKTFEELKFKE
jgi:hypothetical protein